MPHDKESPAVPGGAFGGLSKRALGHSPNTATAPAGQRRSDEASAPVSLRSAIDAKCRECGGQEGGARHWRVHVSACPCTDCPLWRVRPLASRNAPAWLSSRNPLDLPAGWRTMPLADAIATIGGAGAVMQAVTGRNSATAGFAVPTCQAAADAPETSATAQREGGAR